MECFYTAKENRDGLRGECKTCAVEYQKLRREANPEYIKQYRKNNAEKIVLQSKLYYEVNVEKIALQQKQYYKDNPEKQAERGKQYRKTHSEYLTQYRKDNTEKAAEYRRQYYKENAEELIAKKKLYYEANTEQITEYKKQYYEANAEKLAEQRKLYYEANPEKLVASNKQYRKAHPEQCRLNRQRYRTRKKSLLSDFTMEQWESCLSYFDYKDAYTGLMLNSPSQDHVVPLSKGGGYTVDNIVPCECSTNSSKGNRDMLTWFRKQTYYDAEREKKILAYLDEVPSEFNTRKRQGVKSNEYSRTL